MFKLLNDLLKVDDFYGISKNIDLVKGVNRYPDTMKQAMKIAKRKLMSNSAKESSADSGSN